MNWLRSKTERKALCVIPSLLFSLFLVRLLVGSPPTSKQGDFFGEPDSNVGELSLQLPMIEMAANGGMASVQFTALQRTF